MCSKSAKKKILKIDIRVGNKIRFLSVTIEKRMFQFKCGKSFNLGRVLLSLKDKYRVIIHACPIAVGVENPHKFWMCR
jgi:hypothetical protein